MSKRYDELVAELRAAAEALAKEHKVRLPPAFLDALLGDHRGDFMEAIERADSSSWMDGTYLGRKEGLEAARAAITKQAGDWFAAGKDDKAHATRETAKLLDEPIAAAGREWEQRRKERAA